MENAKVKTDTTVSEPDFQKILSSLRNESEQLITLTERCYEIANAIKTIPDGKSEKKDDIAEKEPTCVIDYYWREVWSIRKSNEKLADAINHLFSVVGS